MIQAIAPVHDHGTHVAFHITDPRVTESSGLAAGRRHPGVVYTHDDSGGPAQVFAIGRDGRTRATFTLAGARNRDWEAIAVAGGTRRRPSIYVGDIGDNRDGAWPTVTIYRFTEPAQLRDRVVRPVRYTLRYADGARNAEGMMIDPRTGRLFVVSKRWNGGVYAAPRQLRTQSVNVLRRIGSAPSFATDAAYAPDGASYVIRTYLGAEVFSRSGKMLRFVSLPAAGQGESVSYTADGTALLAGSEGRDGPVWRVPLPRAAHPSRTPRPRRTRAARGGGGRTTSDQGHRAGVLVGLVGAALAAAIAVTAIRRRTR